MEHTSFVEALSLVYKAPLTGPLTTSSDGLGYSASAQGPLTSNSIL